jgi:hypothetical protein
MEVGDIAYLVVRRYNLVIWEVRISQVKDDSIVFAYGNDLWDLSIADFEKWAYTTRVGAEAEIARHAPLRDD